MKALALVFVMLIANSPAMACTDWRAVVAFDALILSSDRIQVAEEREPETAKV